MDGPPQLNGLPSSNGNFPEGTRFRFEIQVQEAVMAINQAITTLEDLKVTATATHDNLNVAKTVGTAASAGGTAVTLGKHIF